MTTEPQDDTVQPAVNDDFKNLAADLEAAQAELAKLREDSLRERAELDNQRRRLARDIEVARKFANERLRRLPHGAPFRMSASGDQAPRRGHRVRPGVTKLSWNSTAGGMYATTPKNARNNRSPREKL